MDYEKKYNEALERAEKELQACGSTDCDAYSQIIRLFPELAESKDERTRKRLINYLLKRAVVTAFKIEEADCKEWIAWLEKQKPVSPTYSLEQAAGIFLDALSKTPYNNKPVTDAQVITKELHKFLSDPKSYNPNAVNEQKFVCEKDIDNIVFDKLTHSLGYPCDTNGNIMSYKETFDTCKKVLIYRLQEKVKDIIAQKSIVVNVCGATSESTYTQAYKEGIKAAVELLSSEEHSAML